MRGRGSDTARVGKVCLRGASREGRASLLALMGILQLFLVIPAFLASTAKAADRDDVYAVGYVGSRIDADHRIQAGATVGYLLFDSVGFGILVDQSFPRSKSDLNRGTLQVGVEGRWFLEPVEVAGAVGVSQTLRTGGNYEGAPFLMISANYLWALTPSLAARAELRGQFLLDGTSSGVFSGIGIRILF
jgi:hypothetical protein